MTKVAVETSGEPLTAHRHLLALSRLLAQQDDQAAILSLIADAPELLGSARTEGIFLDGQWQLARFRDPSLGRANLTAAGQVDGGAVVSAAGIAWCWAYPMPQPLGESGCLVVSAAARPTECERIMLQILAQQAGISLANARLHSRERTRAAQLRATSLALKRGNDIHDRLTQVALSGEGQDAIARAVYELTGHPTAIEDCFGNLRAWAGPGRPQPYSEKQAGRRDLLLRRAMDAGGPLRDGDRLVSVARLSGVPVGVLALSDPDQSAGAAERVTLEHATTVLAMEVAHLQNLTESTARARSSLVLELIAGDDGPAMANRAQALGYDLARPHRVVAVASHAVGDVDMFFRAVSRAAGGIQVGSLIAPQLNDVIVLADKEVPWERFHAAVIAEMSGLSCSMAVGGRCLEIGEFPRSYREAQLALQLQQAVGGAGHVTSFDELGVYQVLGTTTDISAIERFTDGWLGTLLRYDSVHGSQLVLTLSEYLDRGGSYEGSASALAVHRSTLKYRLKRIREVSGHDLSEPDTQFNLHLATRAWRTARVLRHS
jgi:DNA-binding PucR family transcriptional regulator